MSDPVLSTISGALGVDKTVPYLPKNFDVVKPVRAEYDMNMPQLRAYESIAFDIS